VGSRRAEESSGGLSIAALDNRIRLVLYPDGQLLVVLTVPFPSQSFPRSLQPSDTRGGAALEAGQTQQLPHLAQLGYSRARWHTDPSQRMAQSAEAQQERQRNLQCGRASASSQTLADSIQAWASTPGNPASPRLVMPEWVGISAKSWT
jgi:hypothetical protein